MYEFSNETQGQIRDKSWEPQKNDRGVRGHFTVKRTEQQYFDFGCLSTLLKKAMWRVGIIWFMVTWKRWTRLLGHRDLQKTSFVF